jgi:hypothetical protein
MGKSTTFILNLQGNLANLKLDFKSARKKVPFYLVLPYRSPQGVS